MLRDPVVLFLIFWLTTAEVVMCTMAVGMDVKNLPLGLIDHDRSAASRALTTELTSGDSFVLAGVFTSERQAEAGLKAGKLAAVVEIQLARLPPPVVTPVKGRSSRRRSLLAPHQRTAERLDAVMKPTTADPPGAKA